MQVAARIQRPGGLLRAQARRAPPNRGTVVIASAAPISRRAALTGGAAVVAAPLLVSSPALAEAKFKYKEVPVESLGSFQKVDQRERFRKRAEAEIRKTVGPEDQSALLRLVLADVADYDAKTKTGGFNGSIIVTGVPSDLKPVVAKLTEVKKVIDAGDTDGAGPITWPDLMYLAVKIATQKSWTAVKFARASDSVGAEVIDKAYGTQWDVKLGRLESNNGNGVSLPAADAPVEDIRSFLYELGNTGNSGPFGGKPPLWEKPAFVLWTAAAADPQAEEARFAEASNVFAGIKKEYDNSRKTITRTNYEVDFVSWFDRLTNLGSKFGAQAYLYPEKVIDINA